MKDILLVALGGAPGSVLRLLISKRFQTVNLPAFPWPTLLINLTGSFLIGLILSYTLKSGNSSSLNLLLVTGFCGGFTTFSAFSWEVLQLLLQGNNALAIIYMLGSIIIGVCFTFLGYLVFH